MVSQRLKRIFPVCTPNGAARDAVRLFLVCLSCVFLAGATLGLAGCGEKEQRDDELVLGNWTQYKNRAYILLIINPKGTWNSSVRIADATSKIVRSRGNANGSWHMEEGQLIFTVVESDIEEVWEKNNTTFFEIVELGDRMMLLREENGRVGEWNKTTGKKGDDADAELTRIIEMAPYAVNLNKNSSNVQDRYLCVNMHMVLKELMPDQEAPQFHPRARDAAILFLSSLVYDDVENFDKIKVQKKKLLDVLDPYMDGLIKDIEIEHVIIATSVTKVEEFIIEHTIGKDEEEGEAGEDGKEGDGKADEKSA